MQMDLSYDIDDFGPARVLVVREPAVDLLGFVVVDNVAAGPAIGGIRMAADVTVDEVARLARAMTWKNAAAGLAHGGGKGGIVADPDGDPEAYEARIRTFARALRSFEEYIPGPDMGTDETAMAWVRDEIGRCVGLPRVVGGIPLDEIGATGLGVAAAADVAAERIGLELDGARVVVQGFGAVGIHAARFLAERGARLVGVADSRGARVAPDGFPLSDLVAFKRAGHPVGDFETGEPLDNDDLVAVDCDLWIPAARPDVLHEGNVERLRARLVLQGANIPATAAAEAYMHAHDILSIPDFIANAGGVICGAVEYHGGTERQALETIRERIAANTTEVLDRMAADDLAPRAAGEQMARARVRQAMGYRRP